MVPRFPWAACFRSLEPSSIPSVPAALVGAATEAVEQAIEHAGLAVGGPRVSGTASCTADVSGAVAAAVPRGTGFPAVQDVDEAIGYLQQGIDAEDQRQLARIARVQPLVGTGQALGPLDAVSGQGRGLHCFGGGVVQGAPRRLAAKCLVSSDKENELMPGLVDHLRRHRDHLAL